jgi:hypothetical protein
MWVVQPEYEGNARCTSAIINLDCIAWAAHLLPVYGSSFVPEDLCFSYALDMFCVYFVHPYIDHHSHKIFNWIFGTLINFTHLKTCTPEILLWVDTGFYCSLCSWTAAIYPTVALVAIPHLHSLPIWIHHILACILKHIGCWI